MTVNQNVFFERKPAIVPFTRMDAGKKVFEFLRQVVLGHPYEGGEILVNKVAYEWAFIQLRKLKMAGIYPFTMEITDKREFKDDDSTKLFEEDSITVYHFELGCYLKLVSE